MQPARSVATSLGALLGVLVSARALGAPPSCDAVDVEATREVSARWPDLLGRIERALAGRSDIDRCARIDLDASANWITVEVALDDGRSTVRRAATEEDALSALEALLLIPAQPQAEAAESPQREASPPANRAAGVGRPSLPPTMTATPRSGNGPSEIDTPVPLASNAPPESVSVHLALVGGVRVGDAQTSQNLGVMSVVGISDWLLGGDGRAAEYGAGPTSTTTLEFTALGGRRIDNSNVALDLMLGPSFVVQQNSELERTPERTHESKASRIVPRLLLAAHVHLFPKSSVSGFVGLEGFVAAPGASSSDAPADVLGPLPIWMVGLALGATVGFQ